MKLMQIILGDESNDGHGMTETLLLMCSHSPIQVGDLEREAEQKVGVTFSNYGPLVQICMEYEECHLSATAKDLITKAGIDTTKEINSTIYSILDLEDNEDFAELYMRFLQSVDETLRWEFVKVPTLASGIGYGRFFN